MSLALQNEIKALRRRLSVLETSINALVYRIEQIEARRPGRPKKNNNADGRTVKGDMPL